MGRYDSSDQRRIWRALTVDTFGSASWDEYLRAASRADDGRDPTEDDR
jgi:hypothetical protein